PYRTTGHLPGHLVLEVELDPLVDLAAVHGQGPGERIDEADLDRLARRLGERGGTRRQQARGDETTEGGPQHQRLLRIHGRSSAVVLRPFAFVTGFEQLSALLRTFRTVTVKGVERKVPSGCDIEGRGTSMSTAPPLH